MRRAASSEASELKWVSAFTILHSGFHLTERRRDVIACKSWMFVVLSTLNITSKTLLHCYRYFASVRWCRGILWVIDLISSIRNPEIALTPLQHDKASLTWLVGYTLCSITTWSKPQSSADVDANLVKVWGFFPPSLVWLISQATKSFICWNTKICNFNIFPCHHTHTHLEVHLEFGRQLHILHIT